ncbi:MAG: gliding motility-associated ABC transporter ATP-binding subunit GldA [Bacteroidetes bacterium]|nr:MAG: gliding motility-associated ABC transporter ATP-binding subunit GldA [Bacteroidota bacterium]PTM08719.1 MAG: gliding motility-associated ABC transporter ATP-binding subunit GldA [Bacteroidota bacterium]
MSVNVQQLTKIYGTQRAVDGIDFEAKPGEILGFLGPNGAGKTTTMKIITGYLPPTAGQVTVCGIDVVTNTLDAQRQIGYLPEHNPLYKDMYVREYLTFVARLQQLPRPNHRIDDLVEMTGLGKEQHKLIGELSKGYRQRVGLAQAMLHDPQVLILDEPTSGLDPNQLAEIRSLIKQLGEQKTVIFSTHIMQEVQALCNRVVIINQGSLVANDPIERLQARLQGEILVTVTFAKPVSKADLTGLAGVQQATSLGHNRWRLAAVGKTDIRPAIFHLAVAKDAPLLELRQEELSIEDVFRQLTEKKVAV